MVEVGDNVELVVIGAVADDEARLAPGLMEARDDPPDLAAWADAEQAAASMTTKPAARSPFAFNVITVPTTWDDHTDRRTNYWVRGNEVLPSVGQPLTIPKPRHGLR